MSETHAVWSWHESSGKWMEVASGPRSTMEESLYSHRRAAARQLPSARYTMTLRSQPPNYPPYEDEYNAELDRIAATQDLGFAEGNSGPGVASNYVVNEHLTAGEIIAEQRAVIARLTAELDQARGRNVLLCIDSAAEAAMAASKGEEPGTILRTTDTMRAWELGDDRTWRPRA